MTEPASSFLTPWASFYALTGSAAAALTGLMFVAITLVTGERARRSPDGIKTFSTPTVVHFGAALLVSATLAAPWHSLIHLAAVMGVIGLVGVVYALHLMHRTRKLSQYSADVEDWVWYTILPFVSYGAILAGAFLLLHVPVKGLSVIAGGTLLQIFIGIHNAWDIVTFIATGGADEDPPAPS
jgi:hypothetical protein